MTDPAADATALRADRADRLLETLRLRAPAEADLQASAMVMAGLRMLQEVRGTPAVLDTLSRIGPALVVDCPDAAPAAAASASEAARPADLVEPALAYLRGLPVEVATQEASAAAVAANTFLAEVGAVTAVLVPAPAPERLPAVPPERLACALVDQLRGLHRGEAHERARATVAGAAAYLHETFGRSYTAALLDGTLQAAAEYGDTARGGRDSLDMLH